MGSATPEDPGTDFGMCVWIEAPDEATAQSWGKVILTDYVRARFQDSEVAGLPFSEEGWIEKDEKQLEEARLCDYPVCRLGEIPTWHEPWKRHNARKSSTP